MDWYREFAALCFERGLDGAKGLDLIDFAELVCDSADDYFCSAWVLRSLISSVAAKSVDVQPLSSNPMLATESIASEPRSGLLAKASKVRSTPPPKPNPAESNLPTKPSKAKSRTPTRLFLFSGRPRKLPAEQPTKQLDGPPCLVPLTVQLQGIDWKQLEKQPNLKALLTDSVSLELVQQLGLSSPAVTVGLALNKPPPSNVLSSGVFKPPIRDSSNSPVELNVESNLTMLNPPPLGTNRQTGAVARIVNDTSALPDAPVVKK